MGIGTDTYPHNFVDEMRSAANHARAIVGTVDDLETFDVFNAATLGGAKADIVLVDLDHPAIMPVREPLRSLIYVAADRAVRDIYVDGQLVVVSGVPLHIDLAAASQALEDAQQRSIAGVPDRDWAGPTADELAPMVLETN